MNRLLVILGVVSVIIGGLYVAENFGVNLPSQISEILSPVLLALVIIGLGFIRFNKIIGIIVMALGLLLILTSSGSLGFELIPFAIYPWILIALGARFLVIGFLSGENRA